MSNSHVQDQREIITIRKQELKKEDKIVGYDIGGNPVFEE